MSNFRARNAFSAAVDSLTEQALYKACPWFDSPQKYKSKRSRTLSSLNYLLACLHR